jgi:hypothetical protein
MIEEDSEIMRMDDPAFLAERRRVRAELERTPQGVTSPELRARYEALNEEFIRRARIAWNGGEQ